MQEENGNIENKIVCLNCGTECDDNFCPHCGQSTAVPPRLRMKNFWKGVFMSFGRLTPGFLTTAKGLLVQPWTVIRDHIHGKHIRYSPPVTMLIQVFLYATILYTLIDAVFGTSLIEEHNFNSGLFELEEKGEVNPILIMLDQSVVIQALLLAAPFSFIVYIAYIRHGSRKYNFAEYMAAYLYMYATLIMYDILFGLLDVIPGMEPVTEVLTILVLVVFTVITLVKAFPQDKWWKQVLLLLYIPFLFSLTILITSIIIVLTMGDKFIN